VIYEIIGVAVVILMAMLIGKLVNRYDKSWHTSDDDVKEKIL